VTKLPHHGTSGADFMLYKLILSLPFWFGSLLHDLLASGFIFMVKK